MAKEHQLSTKGVRAGQVAVAIGVKTRRPAEAPPHVQQGGWLR